MRLAEEFGSFFNIVSSSASCLDLAHPQQRAVVGAFFNTFYFVGYNDVDVNMLQIA